MRRYVSTDPVRLNLVRVKVTDAEKARFQEVARMRNLSVAEMVRAMVADLGAVGAGAMK